MHKAIANLAYHPDYHEAFGEDRPNATHSSLTFATGALPYSTNNLGQDTATTGFGGVVVPAHCAHLVAVAECGNTRQAYTCMLHIPKYPYAIASSGPLKTRGDFWVGALRDADKVPDPPGAPGESRRQSIPGPHLPHSSQRRKGTRGATCFIS